LVFIHLFLIDERVSGRFGTETLVTERVLLIFVVSAHHHLLGRLLGRAHEPHTAYAFSIVGILFESLLLLGNGRELLGLARRDVLRRRGGLNLTRVDNGLCARTIVDDVVVNVVVGYDVGDVPILLLVLLLIVNYIIIVHNVFHLQVVRLWLCACALTGLFIVKIYSFIFYGMLLVLMM
jgi:hypothetical protein